MVDARGLTLSLRITAIGRWARMRFRRLWPYHHVHGVPQGVRGDGRRRGRRRRRRRRAPAAAPAVGQRLDIRELVPGGHSPTRPRVHRAVADQGVAGSWHRPAVDLHLDHPDDHRSRLRVEEGSGAGPVLDRLRGDRADRAHFARLVDYDFTAAMEDELDAIADGRIGRTDWLGAFYYGGELGRRVRRPRPVG